MTSSSTHLTMAEPWLISPVNCPIALLLIRTVIDSPRRSEGRSPPPPSPSPPMLPKMSDATSDRRMSAYLPSSSMSNNPISLLASGTSSRNGATKSPSGRGRSRSFSMARMASSASVVSRSESTGNAIEESDFPPSSSRGGRSSSTRVKDDGIGRHPFGGTSSDDDDDDDSRSEDSDARSRRTSRGISLPSRRTSSVPRTPPSSSSPPSPPLPPPPPPPPRRRPPSPSSPATAASSSSSPKSTPEKSIRENATSLSSS